MHEKKQILLLSIDDIDTLFSLKKNNRSKKKKCNNTFSFVKKKVKTEKYKTCKKIK